MQETKKAVEDPFSLVEAVKAESFCTEEAVKNKKREKNSKLKRLKTAKRHRDQNIVY